jgi:hypothetical protein
MSWLEKQMAEFVADRDDALRSMDKATIVSFSNRWLIGLPTELGDDIFWAAVHRARLMCNSFSEQEKKVSTDWLLEHGHSFEMEVRNETRH